MDDRAIPRGCGCPGEKRSRGEASVERHASAEGTSTWSNWNKENLKVQTLFTVKWSHIIFNIKFIEQSLLTTVLNFQEAVKQRNEEAMSCYTAALNETPPNVSLIGILYKFHAFVYGYVMFFVQMHRIQKCLQKLLRALHKDRHHTIAHYKHLLDSSLEQAQREKPATLEHLAEIDRITNQSLLMLERYCVDQ